MEAKFKDKVAIITGGSAGMGKTAALGFAQEGARVVINGRNEEKLNRAADEIRTAGGTVTAIKGDVLQREVVNAIVARTLEEYGRVDILFNYVGGTPPGTTFDFFIKQNEDYWDSVLELNLKTTLRFCRAVVGIMIKQRYGKIINTAALAGRVGSPKMALYAAAKGGIIAFTKSLAQELAQYNINVNCVSPGPIDTPGFTETFGEEGKKPPPFIPMRRIGRPQEVASAVLYLASDDAAFITGQNLAIDGGVSLF